MSGEPGARHAITTLAAQGLEAVVLTFNADSDWLSLTWLRVLGNDSPETAAAIARIVCSLDNGAISISDKNHRRRRTRTVPASRSRSPQRARTSLESAT